MLKFSIIATSDAPIYSLDLDGSDANDAKFAHLNQFIVHASLDVVQTAISEKSDIYLPAVDKFNESIVSAYVTSGGVIFVLLHSSKNYSQFRLFFERVHALYVKVAMNPFYVLGSTIQSPHFDKHVRAVAKQYVITGV